MRIMGLDLGSKTIGVAVSDPLTITAQVLTSIHRTTLAKDLETIVRLVEDHQIEELIIGLPINMDGSRGGAVDRVETFIGQLERPADHPDYPLGRTSLHRGGRKDPPGRRFEPGQEEKGYRPPFSGDHPSGLSRQSPPKPGLIFP